MEQPTDSPFPWRRAIAVAATVAIVAAAGWFVTSRERTSPFPAPATEATLLLEAEPREEPPCQIDPIALAPGYDTVSPHDYCRGLVAPDGYGLPM